MARQYIVDRSKHYKYSVHPFITILQHCCYIAALYINKSCVVFHVNRVRTLACVYNTKWVSDSATSSSSRRRKCEEDTDVISLYARNATHTRRTHAAHNNEIFPHRVRPCRLHKHGPVSTALYKCPGNV